jgi:GTP-binding protein
MPLPLVAIVGAPNVGKSRLFNRLAGGRRSLVHSTAGVTRDTNETRAEIGGRALRLVDTGGMHSGKQESLGRQVEERALAVASDSDLVLFVVDLKAGVTPLDRDLALRLRRLGRPILLTLNKVDASRQAEANRSEAWSLGFGEGLEVSAEHAIGIDELCEAIVQRLPAARAEAGEEEAIPVAIVGRPNAGKSSLFNRMLGAERAIVSPTPGTTRDRIMGHVEHGKHRYRLVDTAGLRREARVSDPLEALSAAVARGAVGRSAIALLVVDAPRGVDRQDLAVAGLAQRTYRPLVVALNKADLLPRPDLAALLARARDEFGFARYAPLVPVSALTGRGVQALKSTLGRVWQEGERRVPTPALNRLLEEFGTHLPPAPRRRSVRLLYATQEGVHPPSFLFYGRSTGRPHFTLRRALENFLRQKLKLEQTPLILRFRARGRPGEASRSRRRRTRTPAHPRRG